jgi:oxygen-independent coproporphyrinogen-3 oxidase
MPEVSGRKSPRICPAGLETCDQEILKPMDLRIGEPFPSPPSENPGLYVHIPFCRTKCPYCNFYSVPSLSQIPDFLEALTAEMSMIPGGWGPFDTIYFGGGTPSLLIPAQIEKILGDLRTHFLSVPAPQITLEANPADLDLSRLILLREAGVRRLNLGVQSFEQDVLKFLGRRHSVRQAIAAMDASRKAGIDQVGLDLIYGVPGQTMQSWLQTLSQAIDFSPEHISCYQLTITGGTPLGNALRRGELSCPPEEELLDFFMTTAEKLENAGFIHYEVSNFAREGRYASRHNQKYWNHTPYLGLGPAAHSYSGRKRWWNHPSVDAYIAEIKSGKLPIQGGEDLSWEQLRMEALFLGLRTRKGIDVRDFSRRYRCDLLSEKRALWSRLQEEGLISMTNGRLRPTRAGMAVADSLALI